MPALPAGLIRAVLIWLLIIAAESAHGALRRTLFSPELQVALRQVSIGVGAVIVFAITWVFMKWLRIGSAREALAVGVFWAVLTFAFEWGLGRLLGMGPDRILADYDPGRGGLMALGLAFMALTPWIVLRLQARKG